MGNQTVVKAKKSKELTKQEIAILKQNSKLSVQEIKDLHRAFWTDFPTGGMTKKGFVKYYEQVKDEKDKTSVLCNHVFAVFDKDHDGTIDFNEFLLAVAADSPADLDGHLTYVFEMCDVSGDGEMDIDELANFLSASLTLMGKTDQTNSVDPKKLAEGVFNTLGMNCKERITKEQFVEGCKTDKHLRELFGGGK